MENLLDAVRHWLSAFEIKKEAVDNSRSSYFCHREIEAEESTRKAAEDALNALVDARVNARLIELGLLAAPAPVEDDRW